MDHGGEAARPTTVESTDFGMAGTVLGGEAHMTSGTFHGQLGAAAARRAGFAEFARHVHAAVGRGEVPVAVFHREPGPGVAYANIVASWRQPGPVDVVLVGPQRPNGVVPVHNNYYGYSALQPRPGAGLGVVLADLLPGGGGAVYNGDYALQPRPGAGHGEVLVDRLPDDAGRGEAFVGQLLGGGVAAYDNYVYYVLQPRPAAGHGEVLVHRLPDDAGHGEAFVGQLLGGGVAAYDNYVYYVLQPRPGAGHGDVLVDLLPDGAGHGEAFVGELPDGGVAVYDDYGYYALQPRPGAGHGEVLVDLLPDGAGHGEVFVGLLPGGGVAVHDDYGYYPQQPRPGVGSGEVFIGPLPDGVGVVFDGSSNFARQTLPAPATRGAHGIAGALRGPNLGAGHDNRGVVGEHLRRLLPFAGIGASSLAINGLAAGPGSPGVAFHLFVLLLGGLFLVILHVLRV